MQKKPGRKILERREEKRREEKRREEKRREERSLTGRIEYIDLFRGFGIILMIMGHIGFGTKFDYWIHAFHMPMFFFISGYFFQGREEKEIKVFAYIAKKVKTLLIPYFVFGIFHYIIFIILNPNQRTITILLRLFWNNTEGIAIAGALWFLTALFFTEIIYFLLERYIRNVVVLTGVILVLTAGGRLAASDLPFRLPYALDAALVGLGLFHIAYLLKKYAENKCVKTVMNLSKTACIVFGIIFTALTFENGYINMRTGSYTKFWLFGVNAIGLTIVGLNIARHLELFKSASVLRWMKTIGKNSIIYVCLNQLVIMYVRKLFDNSGILSSVAVLLATLVVLGVCDKLINGTKLKVIIGKF